LKANKFLNKLLALLRYLFNFKRPVFTELDFVDLVIDEKPVFLIVWKSENAHLLKIKSFAKYYKEEGSAIILIPSTSNELTIKLKSIWRSTTLKVDILHTQIDQRTAAFLLDKIKQVKQNGEVIWNTPLSTLHVYVKELRVFKRVTGFKNLQPVIKNKHLKVKATYLTIKKQPTIKSEMFQYTKTVTKSL
jgi:hypothetical protein